MKINITQQDREGLSKVSPIETKEINYDVGFKEAIFGVLGTEKFSSIEECILTTPNYDFNYCFDKLWKCNILLALLIKKIGSRPSWMDDYVRLMQLINAKTTFEKFREGKFKDVLYL